MDNIPTINRIPVQSTVDIFNKDARRGEDPAFGKGSKAYNRYQGDALNKPNPCVRPIETGPFYAMVEALRAPSHAYRSATMTWGFLSSSELAA